MTEIIPELHDVSPEACEAVTAMVMGGAVTPPITPETVPVTEQQPPKESPLTILRKAHDMGLMGGRI